MKKIYTLLMLFSAVTLFAQTHYEPGYFIDNNGNATNCLIKNKDWKSNPVNFEYKVTETGEPKTATMQQVKEFGITNVSKFIRHTVALDRATENMSRMSQHKEPDWQTETIYLRVLVEGDITLFKYEDANLIRFFTSTPLGMAEQLVYKPYMVGNAVAYNTDYKGQLYTLMKDRITDTERYKKVEYEAKSLTKLFLEYNGNNATEFKKISRPTKEQFHVRITPGVAFTSVSAYVIQNLQRDFDFDTKAVLRLGAEAEVVLPFNNNKWSLFIDPNYQSYENSGGKDYSKTQHIEWNIKYQFVEIPVGIRYHMFLNDKSKFFVDAGYLISVNVGDCTIDYHYTTQYSSISRSTDLEKSSNVVAGAGFGYGDFTVEARYSFNRSIFSLSEWGADHSSIGIIVGYKLF
ncbi:outer membrane beta-barrel protein [Flavobacterium rhizosphaerae]|uniref:Outer membrane beta-barrel protein n=1 Tax=Flavobacterium rhizosphaerae TaxID=3163298 RepID=A0ABW8YWI0_9FLAO